LDHPNIAHVYDAGTTGAGRPYFAMEYVKGVSIIEYCDGQKLTIEERLKLFLEVCEAIQHAHQKAIIHRDIKPSNILVLIEGKKAVPKVIDFGIAKALSQPLTERTLVTEQGQFVGTPEYMSPEQADLTSQDIDTRSDIYSLGVVLYELLTGVLPFDAKLLREGGVDHIRHVIRDQEPKTPSTRLTSLGEQAKEVATRRRTEVRRLAKQLHKELEWIPLKAMRKERTHRYQSASEFADDIKNYLNGSPLIAGPESVMYRLKKFIRRNRMPLTAAACVVVMVLGLMFGVSMYQRAERLRRVTHILEDERYVTEAQKLYAEGRYQDALTRLEASQRHDTWLHDGRLLYARLLTELDRFDEAVQELEKLLGEEPPKIIAGASHYLLAAIYQARDPAKAQEHLQQGESLLPDTAEAYTVRALTASSVKDTLRWLNEALELDPSHYPSLKARTLAAYGNKDFQQMEQDATTLVALRPHGSLGYGLRALARRETGRFDEALKDHNRAIKNAPETAADLGDLYDQRRQTYYLKGDFEKALTDAKKCLELRPEEIIHRFYIYEALLRLGRYKEAKAQYAEILESHPTAKSIFVDWLAKRTFDILAGGGYFPEGEPGDAAFWPIQIATQTYRQFSPKAKRLVALGFRATWSPDGTKLAYGRSGHFVLRLKSSAAKSPPPRVPSGIEILELEMATARLLVTSGKDPVWSPDGRYIAYVREPSLNYYTEEEVWLVPAIGGEPRRVARGGFPSWASDSKRIYYHSRTDNTVYSIPIDDPSAQPKRIIPSPGWYPVISPDGKYIAYAEGSVLRVVQISSGSMVTSWKAPSSERGMLVDRSPDGKELSIGGFDVSSLGLWIYDLERKEARKVFDAPATMGVWSPDKKWLAFDVRGPYFEVWLAPLAAGLSTTQSLAGR